MLKIGEFSKLSLLTVKALRFYEKEQILIPAAVDKWTGYRFYETSQLETAARIKAYRELDLSIQEIKSIFNGKNEKLILAKKAAKLKEQQKDISIRLSIINHILEGEQMKYQATIKQIPGAIVYYSEKRLKHISDKMQFIPECGAECKKLNPNLKAANPEYEFLEYLENSYKETDVLIRHSEAVDQFGVESDTIKFKQIPDTKVISIMHKGAYEQLGEAFAFIIDYAEKHNYKVAGLIRECYIDGIWNKESVDEWLTEIQLPIE